MIAAEAEHQDKALKQLLRRLVLDFHPHPLPPSPPASSGHPDNEVKEIAVLRA